MTLTNQGGSLEEARRDSEEGRDAAALVPRRSSPSFVRRS